MKLVKGFTIGEIVITIVVMGVLATSLMSLQSDLLQRTRTGTQRLEDILAAHNLMVKAEEDALGAQDRPAEIQEKTERFHLFYTAKALSENSVLKKYTATLKAEHIVMLGEKYRDALYSYYYNPPRKNA